jgi:uncharacterized protein YqeY
MKNRINQDLKQAMLSNNSIAKETLRSVIAEITKSEKGNSNIPLNDDQIVRTIESLIKKRKESATIYRANNRTDLAEKEEAETEVLMLYVPQKLSEEDTIILVKQIISDGATNIGMVMKALGNANVDRKLVQDIAKNIL